MRRKLRAAAAGAALGLASAALPAAPSRAQAIDLSRGGPVEVTATDGMEWRQAEQVIIARGNARAVRENVTVTADRLIARYRRKGGAAPQPARPQAGVMGPGSTDTGDNEVYRLEAEGNVHISTPTDQAQADRAVYDIDQAVLVLTGRDLKLTTPSQVLTARDAMEYWSQRRMAVARGDAVVTTNDGRRVQADTLVGYMSEGAQPTAATNASARPAGTPPQPPKPPADPIAASGKLQRVEGFGNVQVRTATETVRGARGVYVPDTGIARLAGDVRITRGQNQLNGSEAVVNLRTGVSTLQRAPGGRVQGLVVPNDTSVPRSGPGSPNGQAGTRP